MCVFYFLYVLLETGTTKDNNTESLSSVLHVLNPSSQLLSNWKTPAVGVQIRHSSAARCQSGRH